MAKIKKRNELSIFEELRLKPDGVSPKIPNKEDLETMDDMYFYNDKLLKRNTYWRKVDSELIQVDKYGVSLDEDDKDYQKEIPKTSKLKEYKTDVKVFVEEEKEDMIICTWWKQNEQGQLTQVNLSEESIKFKVQSMLRDKAIESVSFEIRTMKKKAHEYSDEELIKMIKQEEKKLIKKGVMKTIKVSVMSMLGLSWLPFI
jgi:hypothetical protein